MILKQDLIKAIEKAAPPELAEDWDNCGMQISLGNDEIKRILVALEIDDRVIDEAIAEKVDFVITHHPLIFGKFSCVDHNTITGNHIVRLVQHGISVYSAHTSFDSAPKGNNWYLAELLALKNIECMAERGNAVNIVLKGNLEKPITLTEAAKYVSDKLNLNTGELRIVGIPDKKISSIGICTGAGSEFLELAKANGCELFLTGDIKYHDAQKALGIDMCLMDAGHFGTEKFFTENFSKQLEALMKEKAEIIKSKVDLYPYLSIEK